MKYKVKYENLFKRQYKKLIKQGKDIKKLHAVIDCLANGEELESKHRNQKLVDNKKFKNCYVCHIEPDWLLIYKIDNNELILVLVETGSHSEILNK